MQKYVKGDQIMLNGDGEWGTILYYQEGNGVFAEGYAIKYPSAPYPLFIRSDYLAETPHAAITSCEAF